MIDKQTLDNLITKLQEFAASYAEAEAFATKHAKIKVEYDTMTRELAQFQRAFSDLQRQHQDERQQLGRINAEITRRGAELQRITNEISLAKQHAFGG